MLYEADRRLLSAHFELDPVEHADVMLEAGKRMVAGAKPSTGGTGLVIAISVAAVGAATLEIHRRFILPLFGAAAESIGAIVLQALPFAALALMLCVLLFFVGRRTQRSALASRIAANVPVIVEIFRDGVGSSSGQLRIQADWQAVRAIFASSSRIEIECEAIVIYIPARGFADRRAFIAAEKIIRTAWQEARKPEGSDGRRVS